MARITLRQLLDHAAEYSYGLPAFNINNMEQVLAIMNAARATDAPVILQASRGARSYAGDVMLAKMVEAAEALYPTIPICLHQDHGNSGPTCFSAMQAGFTSVMMDGSLEADAKIPASYDYNAGITSRVAEMAHWVGASVEGELGVLGVAEQHLLVGAHQVRQGLHHRLGEPHVEGLFDERVRAVHLLDLSRALPASVHGRDHHHRHVAKGVAALTMCLLTTSPVSTPYASHI